jgi:rubrerythrin|tara:strand:- start:225 stop:710 length:486 start_codon:yes stop_codon:yes gene_type:complete
MNIFELAIKTEEEGEIYYRNLAKRTTNPEFKRVLHWLADDEARHRDFFKAMMEGKSPEILDSDLLKNVKVVFEKMAESKENFDFLPSEVDIYRKAQQLEKDTMDFYLKTARDTDDHKQKDLLIQMAKEEEKHYVLLDNITRFVQRPREWLENAEFTQLDDY